MCNICLVDDNTTLIILSQTNKKNKARKKEQQIVPTFYAESELKGDSQLRLP